jgi:hypothetical protein
MVGWLRNAGTSTGGNEFFTPEYFLKFFLHESKKPENAIDNK